MALITASRYNTLQSSVDGVMGNGSGDSGYGQTLASSQVAQGTVIQASHMANLYTDMIKARRHQTGTTPNTLASITVGNEIKEDEVSDSELKQMKINTKSQATNYLNKIMTNNDFDIFISVDNNMAGIAAAAHFPALTIPMGYRSDGLPSNITFIAKSKNEQLLYNIAYKYEKQSKRRVAPKKYN